MLWSPNFGLIQEVQVVFQGVEIWRLPAKTELGAVVETPRGAGGGGIREGRFSTRMAPYPRGRWPRERTERRFGEGFFLSSPGTLSVAPYLARKFRSSFQGAANGLFNRKTELRGFVGLPKDGWRGSGREFFSVRLAPYPALLPGEWKERRGSASYAIRFPRAPDTLKTFPLTVHLANKGKCLDKFRMALVQALDATC